MKQASLFVPFLVSFFIGLGCSGSDDDGNADANANGDGAGAENGAAAGDEPGTGGDPVDGDNGGGDNGVPGDDDGVLIVPGDGSAPWVCYQQRCPDGELYACGDCIDNDGDGLIDTGRDPNCLGPCDNNEAGYDVMLTGQPTNQCRTACYYNANSGTGCNWNFSCDSLEPVRPPYDPRPDCAYVGDENYSTTAVHGSRTCGTFDEEHAAGTCDDCMPLVPPGCDCFGCCELPARSGNFVFIGSRLPGGTHPCDFEVALAEYEASGGDAQLTQDERLEMLAQAERQCRLCSPALECSKECERDGCRLCLGETIDDLPAACRQPPSDQDPPGGDDNGGTPEPPPSGCPDGQTACPTGGECSQAEYCFFGCCQLHLQ